MKNAKLLALYSMMLTICSCQTAGEFFNRPKFSLGINNECTAFVNGQEVDATNWISTPPNDYNLIQGYSEDKEYRLFICLKYPKRCK